MSLAAKKKVLVVIVGDFHTTGVITYLEDRLPRLINRCACDVTLYVPGFIVEERRAESWRRAGISIVEARINLKNPISRRVGLRRSLRSLLAKEDFCVIHVNTASRLVNCIALSEAKRAGVPIRIAHSHNANMTLGLLAHAAEPYYQRRIVRLATDLLACSDDAGVFLFGENAWRSCGKMATNGIEVDRYTFDQDRREYVREQYGVVGDTKVIGFVGRFSDQKNPIFLMSVLSEVATIEADTKFWLVGDGPLLQECKDIANVGGLAPQVTFFGLRDDVADLMQGMDALVMPSLYEGMSLVAIEAQASGVACYLSTCFPKEIVSPGCNVQFISLDQSPEYWARKIIEGDFTRRADGANLVRRAGFDLEASTDVLVNSYEHMDKPQFV